MLRVSPSRFLCKRPPVPTRLRTELLWYGRDPWFLLQTPLFNHTERGGRDSKRKKGSKSIEAAKSMSAFLRMRMRMPSVCLPYLLPVQFNSKIRISDTSLFAFSSMWPCLEDGASRFFLGRGGSGIEHGSRGEKIMVSFIVIKWQCPSHRIASSNTLFRFLCVNAEHSRYFTALISLATDKACS